MHQRDYILRMIEQVGAALAELRRRLLRQSDAAGVREALDRTASEVGLSVAVLRAADLPTLQLLVAPSGELDPTRCWLMAEILYLDGLESSLAGSDDDGRESLLKARALYDLVRPMGGMLVGMAEAAERIADIDARLDPPPGPGGPRRSVRPRRVRARRPLEEALDHELGRDHDRFESPVRV